MNRSFSQIYQRAACFIVASATIVAGSIYAQIPVTALESYDRVPWHTPRVSFTPQQRQLRDLLKDFAVSQHLPFTISESVKGVISGSFKDIESEKFLNTLCEAHDLVWFYDGVRMNIETTDEVVSRPLTLAYVTPEAINDVIFSIGYASGPPGRTVQVKTGHRGGVLLLIGGPQFVQATDALARDLDTQEAKRQNDQITVRAFRLNYATASDITLNNGTTNRVIPGVARSLQNLMLNQLPGGAMSTGGEETNIRRSHQGLLGQGLAAIGNSNPTQPRGVNPFAPGSNQQPSGGGAQDESMQRADPQDPRSPMIVADIRLNVVLVRDVASRMPLYEELIKMLDQPTQAIEISAAIVDIDTNNARNLGIDLLGSKDGSGRIGFDADRGLFDGVNTQGLLPSFIDGTNVVRGAGLNASMLLSGNGYDFLSRLRAIEREGAGQVLSSPSVFTMENVQAVIKTEEKVYVRIQGNMATDLFDVTTGVQLRVTPTIVNEGGRKDFRLLIDITDGSFSDTKVDSIPATRESAINTTAMVPNSRTLLLGGYTVERRTTSDSSVPLLNKIRVLGKLLSRTERNHERRQRFFFITPRLVDLPTETTSPQDPLGNNPLEIKSRLPEADLARDTPEQLARKLAASTVRNGTAAAVPGPGVLPALPYVEPTESKKRQPLFDRWFKKSTPEQPATFDKKPLPSEPSSKRQSNRP